MQGLSFAALLTQVAHLQDKHELSTGTLTVLLLIVPIFAVVAPQSFSAAGRLDPAGAGVAIAWVNLFNDIGFIVGSGLVGVLADISDMRLAFVVPLVLVAAIVALTRGFEPALRARI